VLADARLTGELLIHSSWFSRGEGRCPQTSVRGETRFQGFDSFNRVKYVSYVYLAISEVYLAIGNV